MSASLLGLALKAKLGSRTRKLVLIKLVDACQEDGTRIYPALATIAADSECSVPTARRTMKEFCQVGLLRKVKDGGSGPGSTAHYEMDIELLARLRRPELWPALEAAAMHDPLPDVDEEDDAGHALGADQAHRAEGADRADKGITVEGYHRDRLSNGELRVSSDDTQPLNRTLNSEREGVREHETSPTIEGSAILNAGHASGEGQAEASVPTFDAFLEAYPFAKGDNRMQLRSAWEAVPFAERQAAIDGIGAFSSERRAGGLKSRLSAPAYLGGRCWIGLEVKSAGRQAAQAATALQTIAPWSRDWWLLLLLRISEAQRVKVSFAVQQAEANKPLTASAADMASAVKHYELKPYLCNGPEIDAWRPWLAQAGARIPVFEGYFRVFLPGPMPPGGRAGDGDEEVKF